VACCAAVIQVVQSLLAHFRSVLRVILRQEARVLNDSLLADVAAILVLVECAGIPQHHAAGLDMEHAFAVGDGCQVVAVNELPVLRSSESTRLDVLSVEQVRAFIDNECSRLVLGECHETLDTLKVAIVWCLICVGPDVVSLACATWYPATSVETGDEFVSAPDFAEWSLDCVASADEPRVLLVADFAELEDAMRVDGVVKFLDLRDAVDPLVEVALCCVNLIGCQHIFDNSVAHG